MARLDITVKLINTRINEIKLSKNSYRKGLNYGLYTKPDHVDMPSMSPLKAAFRSLRYLARYVRNAEKNNPPVGEERDSEMSTICLWLFFSYASISNHNSSKSTDSSIDI